MKLIDTFLTSEECREISEFILKYEDDIKALGPDIYTGTADNSLSGRHWCYNYLYDTPGKILVPKVKEEFGECIVQCWANTFRYGEGIKPHAHGVDPNNEYDKIGFTSVNIFLQGPTDVGTIYNSKKEINKVGQIAIFGSRLVHSVPPNPYNNVRISMAMDVYTDPRQFQLYKDYPQRFYHVQ